MDPQRQIRLNTAAQLAVKVERDTAALDKLPVPAEATVSQWAAESEWGLAPCGNNYFGIKWTPRNSMMVVQTTHETLTPGGLAFWNRNNLAHPARVIATAPDGRMDCLLETEFADYPDEESSVRDYCWLIANGTPYRDAWLGYVDDRDVDKLLAGIAAHYSTSDSYRDLVTSIEHQQNIKQAIQTARASRV